MTKEEVFIPKGQALGCRSLTLLLLSITLLSRPFVGGLGEEELDEALAIIERSS